MASVAGRPFIEWVVRYLAAQRIRNVILSTGHLAETVEKHFQSEPVAGIKIRCVPETKPLGTAGGFLNAISHMHTNETPAAWLVLNGDSLALASLEKMFQALDDRAKGALLGIRVADAARFGTISQTTNGDLTGFSEKKAGAGIINAGVYLFRPGIIENSPDKTSLNFETDVFPALLASGVRLRVCVTDAPFLDIGTPESLPLAESFIRDNADCFQTD